MKYITCYILISVWGILVVIGGSISTTKDSLLNIIRYTSAGFH